MEKAAATSMASSYKASPEVQRSSELIPYQDFSLPWPIIRYICTNSKSTTQLKLFSTCQQLKKLIAKERGCQVDAVYFSHLRYSHRLYINNRKLVQLDLSYHEKETINFRQSPKLKSLHFDLNDMYVDFEEMIALLHKFDYSIAEKVDLWMYADNYNQKLDIDVLRPMFVPTLKKLLLRPSIEIINGDLLTMALTELPNLKKLRMGWQNGITNLATAAAIPRTNKLKFFELRKINDNLTAQTVFNFIVNQMSLKGVVQLGDEYGFACKCFRKEIYGLLASKRRNVKLQLGRVHACRHK